MHTNNDMDSIELLAPAGSFETALSAFESGADAVYLGLDAFSARAQAINFSAVELSELMTYARAKGRKVYVTFNTLLTDTELEDAVERLAVLEEIAPDALIVQDIGVARVIRKHFPSLPIHASTQLVAHNLEGVLALKELGFTRVVLARELPIEDIRSIVKRCGCEIEVFVHGALCYSISGLCLFSAMERRRSGNRGRCAYCCRLPYSDSYGGRSLPFSMRDLRLDDRLDALREAGVASLKIEGRMKSSLYVASVVKRYRELLDGGISRTTREDLETVFSRSTTHLYADGWKQTTSDLIDSVNLGHQGTPVGIVKRITKDREGRSWLRFHTSRALEKHDGLQFVSLRNKELSDDARPLGMGIGEMRLAISRKPVFEAYARSDVEIEIADPALIEALSDPDMMPVEVRCSMSNEVKRRFPVPSFRAADYPGVSGLDVTVRISADGVEASARGECARLELPSVQKANRPELTEGAVRKCFGKLGGTVWSLSSLKVEDPEGLFVPASIMNELRRELVARLDDARVHRKLEKIEDVKERLEEDSSEAAVSDPMKVVKVRLGQNVPPGDWDEVVVVIGHSGEVPEFGDDVRLALPVFTKETDYSRFRARVKNLVRSGYAKWEAADLAGIRMLKSLGVEDITADWTVYAFNSQSILALSELGVKRCVLSPECDPRDTPHACVIPAERIIQQSTPLFISVTKPAAEDTSRLVDAKGGEFTSFELDGLWITTRVVPKTFPAPSAPVTRIDLSWDPEVL
ncbi:MAG: U32 family peptidase [Kiritimatiellae bacterium]|nr:U32 family peptidase [Kiritimatiellia bacterium]